MATWKKVLTSGAVVPADITGSDGSADQVLKTNGSGSFSWADLSAGDLTAIVAGDGLTGSSLSGPIPTITANTDNVTLEIVSDAIKAKTAAIADGGTGLATADQIYDFVTAFGYTDNSGDITGVSFTCDNSASVTDSSGQAAFTITGGTGISTSAASATVTITLNDQLIDIAGMTATETTALATIPANTFDVLGGQGSNNLTTLAMGSSDGFIVEDSTGQTSGNIKSVTPASAVSALQAETWTFAENVTMTGNLTVNGTTTTIQTANLTVEDKNIVLGKPDSAFADDAAAITENTGGGISIVTDSTTAGNYANLTWNTSKNLTGWCLEDTANAGVFEAAVMEYSSDSTAPTGDAAGVGSLHYDTGDDKLYLRTA